MYKEIINLQVAAEGFGSYAIGILPTDIATAAGAFGASMQQIKNILNIPIEKFAQVVANLETTKGIPVNGTNVPVNVDGADIALGLVALGSGPKGTYTTSDFFGCMSGLSYDWINLQKLILDLQTPTLTTIYDNLYIAVQGGVSATVQTYIDQANAEIAVIRSVRPGKSMELNAAWEKFGSQLTTEQQARVTGLAHLPVPRDAYIAMYPVTQYAFVDAIPRYGVNTLPHMYAQTLEKISDLTFAAMMREIRNEARLADVGIELDNNIPDMLSAEETTILMTAEPGVGVYDPITGDYLIDGVPIDTGAAVEPGSFADSPYQDVIPPELNVLYASGILLPAVPTIQEAIDEVIRCNCDCWEIL